MLLKYHSVDIQWGNRDIVWMGAAAGQTACIANVVRMCAYYNNMDLLEEGYGINLTPLVMFTLKVYGGSDTSSILRAILMIQLKLEGQLIKKYPEFGMTDRLFLDTIDTNGRTVVIGGRSWKLNTSAFPTLTKENPYQLTPEESEVVQRLRLSFKHCTKLQTHVRFLYSKGSLHKIYNGNLLYHGCMPFDAEGCFAKVSVSGRIYSGRDLYDILEAEAREGYFGKDGTKEKNQGEDIFWYLWTGPCSPVFGKDKMAAFETVYIDDPDARKEEKNLYYNLIENEIVIDRIFREFGLDPAAAHIINGHMPQQITKRETPVKCGGRLLIIDGGFSAAYHEKTGIAGYTLVSNSHGMKLIVLEKFENTESAILNETDIVSDTQPVETFPKRRYVADTETGRTIKQHIQELEQLLDAYRDGSVSTPVSINDETIYRNRDVKFTAAEL